MGSQTFGSKTYSGTIGIKQNDNYASHTHTNTLNDPGHIHTTTYQYEKYDVDGLSNLTGGNGDSAGSNAINSNTTGITINNLSAGSVSETYPGNITLAYIIKF